MKYFVIKLNNKCNANCIFCEIPRQTKNQEEPLLKDKLKELTKKRKNFDSLIISGGEPLIYPNVLEFIKYAKEICKYKQITLESNGLLFYYTKVVDKLIKSGVDRFQVSFQTTDKKEYDKITGIKDSYKYVIKGIENIKKEEKYLHINVVIHKYNYKKLPDITKTLVKKKVDSIQLAFLNPIGSNIKQGKAIAAIEYSKTIPYIKESIKISEDLRFDALSIIGCPVCIGRDFKDKIEINYKVLNSKDQTKKKSEKCKQCTSYNSCEGVWSAYLEQFGGEELKPIN